MSATMHAIKDFYVASSAIVTGNVTLGPGVNLWFGTILRGDLALIARASRQLAGWVHRSHRRIRRSRSAKESLSDTGRSARHQHRSR